MMLQNDSFGNEFKHFATQYWLMMKIAPFPLTMWENSKTWLYFDTSESVTNGFEVFEDSCAHLTIILTDCRFNPDLERQCSKNSLQGRYSKGTLFFFVVFVDTRTRVPQRPPNEKRMPFFTSVDILRKCVSFPFDPLTGRSSLGN